MPVSTKTRDVEIAAKELIYLHTCHNKGKNLIYPKAFCSMMTPVSAMELGIMLTNTTIICVMASNDLLVLEPDKIIYHNRIMLALLLSLILNE